MRRAVPTFWVGSSLQGPEFMLVGIRPPMVASQVARRGVRMGLGGRALCRMTAASCPPAPCHTKPRGGFGCCALGVSTCFAFVGICAGSQASRSSVMLVARRSGAVEFRV